MGSLRGPAPRFTRAALHNLCCKVILNASVLTRLKPKVTVVSGPFLWARSLCSLLQWHEHERKAELQWSFLSVLAVNVFWYSDRTNLPKEVMMFPDFPFEPQLSSFLPHQEVQRYLERYCQSHGIRPHIRVSRPGFFWVRFKLLALITQSVMSCSEGCRWLLCDTCRLYDSVKIFIDGSILYLMPFECRKENIDSVMFYSFLCFIVESLQYKAPGGSCCFK